MGRLDIAGSADDPGGVIIARNMLNAGTAAAADDKAPRKQQLARPLADGVALTRQQRLVDLDLAGHHNGVGADLRAGTKQRYVVEHHLADGDLLLFPVTQHNGVRGCHQRQPVNGALGAYLLEGSDGNV